MFLTTPDVFWLLRRYCRRFGHWATIPIYVSQRGPLRISVAHFFHWHLVILWDTLWTQPPPPNDLSADVHPWVTSCSIHFGEVYSMKFIKNQASTKSLLFTKCIPCSTRHTCKSNTILKMSTRLCVDTEMLLVSLGNKQIFILWVLFIYLLVCLCAPLWVYVHHVPARCLLRLEENIKSPGTRVVGSCMLSDMHAGPNLNPLWTQ